MPPSFPLMDAVSYARLSEAREVLIDLAHGCHEPPRSERARCLALERALADELQRTGRVVALASETGDLFTWKRSGGIVMRASLPVRTWLETKHPPVSRPAGDLDDRELQAAARCGGVVTEALSGLKTRYELALSIEWRNPSDGDLLFRATERAYGEAELAIANVRVLYEHRNPRGALPDFGKAGSAASEAAAGKTWDRSDETDFATGALDVVGVGMVSLLVDGIQNTRDFCTVERLPTPSHDSDQRLMQALDKVLVERAAKLLPPLVPAPSPAE